jgi:Holliday junction DNA helicase RuvA
MIAALNGNILVKEPGYLIVDVGGVGYEVHISAHTYDRLPVVDEPAALLVHTAVREDAITLYGFAGREEKELFLLLNSISGVGPKLALAILSGLATDVLIGAIGAKDVSRLTTISGVGKKTAERLCMELQEKVGHLHVPVAAEGAAVFSGPVSIGGGEQQDAVSALVNLGYSQQVAWQAVNKVLALHGEEARDLNVEVLIRESLQALA